MTHPTALVVGGTSGIGLATARQLVATGVTVYVSGRDKIKVDDAMAALPGVSAHSADACDHKAMSVLASSIGTIDLLIITAGGSEGIGLVNDLDLDMLRRTPRGSGRS